MAPPRARALVGAFAVLTVAVVANRLAQPVHAPAEDPKARPVRLVLITLDTLRFDGLMEEYGRPSPMPRTRERAKRGLVFERFYSSSSTTQPSHASILTGLQPWEHHVYKNGDILAETHRTVPEVLRDAGFSTSAVVASFPLSRRFGLAQGFAAFSEDFTVSGKLGHFARQEVPGGRFYSLADTVTDAALAQLDQARGERQFFWFHYYDPHSPYGDRDGRALSPNEILRKANRKKKDVTVDLARARSGYDEDLAFLDAQLDRLFARLDADASRYETHVVAVSDHGESFGEDGSVGHGKRLTPWQVHVPLVLWSPRAAPQVRADVAGSVDVARTLLALAGVADAAIERNGRDLTQAPAGGALALGMRRAFAKGAVDERLDGSAHPLDRDLFYAVDASGLLHVGSGAGLEVSAPDAERFVGLFRSLEGRLRGAADTAADPEVEEGLKALGYVN